MDMFDIPHLVSLHLVCPFRCWVSRLEDGVFGEPFVSFPCCFEITLNSFKMLGNLALGHGRGRRGIFSLVGEGLLFLLSSASLCYCFSCPYENILGIKIIICSLQYTLQAKQTFATSYLPRWGGERESFAFE